MSPRPGCPDNLLPPSSLLAPTPSPTYKLRQWPEAALRVLPALWPSASLMLFRQGCFLHPFYRSRTKAQLGENHCPGSQTEKAEELGFETRPTRVPNSSLLITLSPCLERNISKRGCPGTGGHSSCTEGPRWCRGLGREAVPWNSRASPTVGQDLSTPYLLLYRLSLSPSSTTYKQGDLCEPRFPLCKMEMVQM